MGSVILRVIIVVVLIMPSNPVSNTVTLTYTADRSRFTAAFGDHVSRAVLKKTVDHGIPSTTTI